MTALTTRHIDLLRHGAVAGPAALYGSSDPKLSEAGQQGFIPLFAQKELPWQRIISSPRIRCLSTARALAEQHQLPLEIWPELAEMHFGEFDGVPFDELGPHWHTLERFWQAPAQHPLPDAEPIEAFHARLHQAWQRLLQHDKTSSLLVVCHAGVIRQLLADLLFADWRRGEYHQRLAIPHASLTRLQIWYGDAEPIVQIRSLAAPLLPEYTP